MHEYEEEAQERWGDTEAFRQSKVRTSKYTHADFEAAKVDQESAVELFVTAFGNSLPVDSSEAQKAVLAHI
ncbi:MAG: TipAS antibiotic-recognition domain-containing protein [Actinomycetes bacterium]